MNGNTRLIKTDSDSSYGESDVLVSIGTAARLAGVSTHVLRAWESRYNLKLSSRDARGRRVYKQASIEFLKLLNEGLAAGYKISELAGLSTVELLELLFEKEYVSKAETLVGLNANSDKWLVFGLKLSNVFYRELGTQSVNQANSIRELHQKLSKGHQNFKGVAIEIPDIDENAEIMIMRIKILVKERFPVAIMTNSGIPSSTLKRLHDAAIHLITDSENNSISSQLSQISTSFELSNTDVKDYFENLNLSDEQLASLEGFAEEIYCECPRHISRIYRDVDEFIKYVTNCEVLSPKDKFLHVHMLNSLKTMRCNMVRLAMEVATIEGVELFKSRKQ